MPKTGTEVNLAHTFGLTVASPIVSYKDRDSRLMGYTIRRAGLSEREWAEGAGSGGRPGTALGASVPETVRVPCDLHVGPHEPMP